MDQIQAGTERKAGFILAAIALAEGCWVFFVMRGNPAGFFRYAGFLQSDARPAGWILAALVILVFVGYAARLPSVRANLFRPSYLKLLGFAVALTAGFCEEMIFRKWLMDYLQHQGSGLFIQVLISALAFGAAHAVWGLMRGSVFAALGAMVATGALGLALALVYIAGGRVVAPCIIAHLLINLLVEPGLVLAAVRGEMGKFSKKPAAA